MTNNEFYSTMGGMSGMEMDMLLGCIPSWLFGPLGYALFALLIVVIRYHKNIKAFVSAGFDSFKNPSGNSDKKSKKHKKHKKHKNFY